MLWFFGGSGILLAVLCIMLLLSFRLADQEIVINTVRADVSKVMGGDVEFQGMDLFLFPYPKVVFNQFRLVIAGKATVAVGTLSIRPEIIPLLSGSVRFSSMTFHSPIIDVMHPWDGGKEQKPRSADYLKAIEETVTSIFGLLLEQSPALVLKISSGQLNIRKNNQTVYRFQDIFARLGMKAGNIDVDLQCNSNLWDHISLKSRIDSNHFKSRGTIDLKGIEPRHLIHPLWPDFPVKLQASQLDLVIQYDADGFDAVKAELQGRVGSIDLQTNRENIRFQGNRFAGSIHLDANRSVYSLTELDLDQPQLSVSGTLETGPIRKWRSAPARFELNLKDVDVDTTRPTALAVLGGNPLFRTIFNVVRGGKVPLFRLTAGGATPSHLWKKGNVFMEGRIVNGKVHVPGVALDLENVRGEVVISDRILVGKNLEATLGNTYGSSGKLLLVFKKNVLYQVDIGVDADLAQLPPILQRLIGRGSWTDELDGLSRVEGRATGQLGLKGGSGVNQTVVDVSSFNLSAEYQRLPHLLEISSGEFSYGSEGAAVKGVAGKLGKSSFAAFTAGITWNSEPGIEVHSGTAEINLKEIHPWLTSFKQLKTYRKYVKSIDGIIALSEMRLSGPLFVPTSWHLETKGSVDHLAILSSNFSDPILFSEGAFHMVESETASTLSFTDARETLMGTTLKISGVTHNLLKDINKADIQFEGDVNPKFLNWLYRTLHLPQAFLLLSPLSISHSRLVWSKDGKTVFKGRLQVPDGPGITIDMFLTPESFTINEFHIRDGDSEASFSLDIKEGAIHTAFFGRMTCNTLNALFADYPPGEGWVEGDIQADIFTDQPFRAAIEGTLQGKEIHCPFDLQSQLHIPSISLNAEKTLLTLENAVVKWQDSLLSLKGTVDHSTPDWQLDLSLVTDSLNWDKLKKMTTASGKTEDSRLWTFLKNQKMQGKIGLTADQFVSGDLVWHSLDADIRLLPSGIDIAVTRANLCGIETPGTIKIVGGNIDLDFKPFIEDHEVNPTVTCLRNKEVSATGTYRLEGHITARATADTLVQNLKGDLEFTAKDGRIYRHIPLAKLFAFLDIIEIFKQIIPNLKKEGFPYRSMVFKGHLDSGKLHITEGIINSPVMEIACKGDVDLKDKTLDLMLLVAPMQTVNFLIKKVPVVNQIMGGTLVSIPVEIRGDIKDPKVSAVPPGRMAAQGLIGIMKRIVQLPVTIIQPILPENN